MKTCTKCGQDKPLHEFSRRAASADGLSPICKPCKSEAAKAHYQANRDQIRSKAKAYRAANKEKKKAADRAYYEANKAQILEQVHAYHRANRDRIAAQHRAWREANRDHLAAYRAAHPERTWRSNYRTRARKHGFELVEEPFTKADVIERYGDACAYCETGDFEHLDHYMPVSEGGHHTLDNARPSCAACNFSKSDTPGDEWEAEQARLDNLTPDELNAEIDAEIARWSTP